MERVIRLVAVAGLLVVLGGGPALAAPAAKPPTVALATVGKFGAVLVDGKGMTLYRYTPDRPGRSACAGGCAVAWPPLLKGASLVLGKGLTGTLGTITRADKKQQVTYNGIPLYRYAADRKAGSANGQGAGRVWFVVKKGERLAVATPSATTTTTRPTALTTTVPLGPGGAGDAPDYGGGYGY